ncbi:MAG: hypothetical protein JW797_00515 [Bradymonadales bacterium]|nr:hypothetical protein [Bradymonadales bacterium]
MAKVGKGGLWWLLLVAASLSGGCPGAWSSRTRLDPASPSGRELEQISGRIRPYDLEGETPEGLERLDDWIDGNRGDEVRFGLAFRADTQLDLWLFGLMAVGMDDEAAASVLEFLAERVDMPEVFDRGPDDESLSLVSEALKAWVLGDYQRAGVHERQLSLVEELFDVRPWDLDAPAFFRRWRDEVSSTPRLRLLLATTLACRPGPWSGDRVQALGPTFIRDFGWLCQGGTPQDLDELAEACGYWCARLPSRQVAEAVITGEPAAEWIEDEVESDLSASIQSSEPEAAPEAGEAIAETSRSPAWDPTPMDIGYELVRACGAEYFGLPQVGGVVLLDEAIYLDLTFLSFMGRLLGEIESERGAGEPLSVLSGDLMAELSERVLSSAVSSSLTPAAYRTDPRLELPWIKGLPQEGLPAEPYLDNPLLITMHSDGIYLGVNPHLRLERGESGYRVSYAELEEGYHFPGRRVVPFSSMNRLEPQQVEAGRIPDLANALVEARRWMERTSWITAVAQPVSGGGEAGSNGECLICATLLVDSSTYMDTLKPVVATLLQAQCRPLFLVLLGQGERIGVLPLPFRSAERPADLRLRVGDGRLVLLRGGGGQEDPEELFQVERRHRSPYLALYRELSRRVEAGELAPDLPLSIELADDQLDFGILVHLVAATAYRREVSLEVQTDAQLLEAPITMQGEEPMPLVLGGVEILY